MATFKYSLFILNFEVGSIKSKFLTLVILVLTLNLFFIMFTEKSIAANQAQVSFLGQPTYRLIRSIERNGQVIGKTFQINVTLHNSGNLMSDELTVNLSDEEGFTLTRDKIYLDQGDTKIISFTWSTTTLNRNQQIKVLFFPSDLNVSWNEFNSGSTTFTIKVTDSGGLPAASTPGFEIIVFLSAVTILIFLLKKKR